MNLSKRLCSLLILLFSASLLLTLILLFSVDRGSFSQLQELADRLSKSDKERQQILISENALGPLTLMASQISERRDDLIEGVQQLASDGALRAIYASPYPASGSTKTSPGAKAETLQQILTRWATVKKGVWDSADLTDNVGRVLASWPTNAKKGQDISKDGIFVHLSSAGAPLGISAIEFLKIDRPASKTKDGKNSQASVEGQLVLACGIEGGDGNFAGLLKVHIPVNKLLGLRLDDFLKPIRTVSSKATLILMRGTGEQVFHSSKGPYAENFDRMNQEFKSAMADMQSQSEGKLAFTAYEGKPGLLVWKRVGAWQSGVETSSLMTLVALLGEEDFKSMATNVSLNKPVPFWARPVILLLLVLAFVAPLSAGWMLFRRETRPVSRLVEVANQIDEEGVVPEGLEFHQESDPEIHRANQGLNSLILLSRNASNRMRELDGALSRAEEQASNDATRAAQELANLRSKLSAVEIEKAAAKEMAEVAQRAQREADIYASGLKNTLQASQRDVDLKNSENKNLLIQVQELTQKLEEKFKLVETAQPSLPVMQSVSLREEEMVRLSAVNTLSNELKATLLVIKNYVSSMLGSSSSVSEQQQEFLGVVINKSARLERLIADLVELSEISSGVKPLLLEKTRLSALLEESLSNIRLHANQKNISLDLTGEDSDVEVSVDKEKFGGIIRALMSQAIKVTSRSERVSILISGDGNHAELRMTDPGMSLTPDRAAKVFNQFHGVDSQAGPEFIGTGLRFSIMRAVVEAHGGKIWIESQAGRGKTFVISLPAVGLGTPLTLPSELKRVDAKIAGSKIAQAEFAGFNSIFGEMPAVGTLPSLPVFNLPPVKAPGVKEPLKEEDKAGFDAIFGIPDLSLQGKSSLPMVEFKTEAVKMPLPEKDVSNFDAIFGALPVSPKIAPAPESPSGPSGMDDLNNMFK